MGASLRRPGRLRVVQAPLDAGHDHHGGSVASSGPLVSADTTNLGRFRVVDFLAPVIGRELEEVHHELEGVGQALLDRVDVTLVDVEVDVSAVPLGGVHVLGGGVQLEHEVDHVGA
jgi:hypothetical protein